MTIGSKIAIFAGITSVSALAIYLWLRSKKKAPLDGQSNLASSTSLTNTSSNQTTTAIAKPTTQEISTAASEVITQLGGQTKQASDYAFANSPVPLPGDMTVSEIQALNEYCKLPDGQTTITKVQLSAGRLTTNTTINYDMQTKRGIANTLRDRAGQKQSYDDYFNKLKSFRGC